MSDLLIINANILTLDPRRPHASALLIRDGRIADVGRWDDFTADTTGIQTLDLNGQTVVPGFIDSHVHFTWTGIRAWTLDLSAATNISDVMALVAERASDGGHGLILGQGLDPDIQVLGSEIDRLVPSRPVLLQGNTGHFAVANQAMLAQLGLRPGDPGLNEAGILRGAANTRAAWRVPAQFAAEVGWEQVFGSAAAEALRVGITTLHALEGEDRAGDPAVLALQRIAPDLPIGIVLYYQTRDVAAVTQLGLPRIGGCIWIDGDFAPHTAALQEPYADEPGTCGCLYFDDAEVEFFIEQAHLAGLQIALHCVGDAAVAQVLRAYRRALTLSPRTDHRHRIEHFEVYDATLLEEARELGVHVAIQPPFDGYFGGIEMNARFLGAERAQRADPIRTFDRAGIPIGGGSDCPVTPLNPLYGIHCAVNHSNLHERITPQRALELFTIDNARIAFEEAEKGSIEIGKFADLTILREDPLTVAPERIKDIDVMKTIVRGRVHTVCD